MRSIRLKERRPGMNMTLRGKHKADPRQYGPEEGVYPLRTDSNGFIIPSGVHKDPQLTLVFLGGSTTECVYVDEESRWPHRASVLLGKRLDRRVNSFNGGASGANTMHLLDVLLNKVAALRPDVVVLMENINDVNIMLFAGSYWNDHRSRSLIVAEEEPGRMARLGSALWGLLPEKTDPIPTVSEWPQFLQGCIRYRQSLDEQAPEAPRSKEAFPG